MKFTALLVYFIFIASPAFANDLSAYIGHYHGVDGNWLHPFSAEFEVQVTNGYPVITSTNISQQQSCEVHVGSLLSMNDKGGDVDAIYALEKSPSCSFKANSIYVIFHSGASGCSEWSPKITASYVLADTPRDGSVSVYWGLVKEACH